MGSTTRVYLINRSMHEHTRVFTTIKSMCEVFNKEYKEKGYDRSTLNSVLFNVNSLRDLNWKQPHKYKGHTIRRMPIERT